MKGAVVGALITLVALAVVFPEERDQIATRATDIWNGNVDSDSPRLLPSQPFRCGDTFISFEAAGPFPGPMHVRRASIESLSFTHLGIEIVTATGEWISVGEDEYLMVSRCLVGEGSGDEIGASLNVDGIAIQRIE